VLVTSGQMTDATGAAPADAGRMAMYVLVPCLFLMAVLPLFVDSRVVRRTSCNVK